MARHKGGSGGRRRRELAAALAHAKRVGGLTQAALAEALGTSQPTLSKLLNAQHEPRPALARRIDAFLSGTDRQEASEAQVRSVLTAYRSSDQFRRVVDAALVLANINE